MAEHFRQQVVGADAEAAALAEKLYTSKADPAYGGMHPDATSAQGGMSQLAGGQALGKAKDESMAEKEEKKSDAEMNWRQEVPTPSTAKKAGDGAHTEELTLDSEHVTHPRVSTGTPGVVEPKEADETKKASDGEKKKDEEVDDEKDEDEDDEKDAEKSQKNTVGADTLMKALVELEGAAAGKDPAVADRRQQLAEGFAQGTLSKSDREELSKLIAEQKDAEPELAKSETFQQAFATDEQLAKDYDISPFIEHQSQLMAKALDAMNSEMRKSHEDQGMFNRALAKSFKGIGEVVQSQQELIKSQQQSIDELSKRLGSVESTPLPRKALSGAQALAKSSAGDDGTSMTRDQIMDGMFRLMQKSSASSGYSAPCGEPLDRSISLFEQTGAISRSLLEDVKRELQPASGLR